MANRNSAQNLDGLPVGVRPTATRAEDFVYDDAAAQPPPLKRAKTSQPSRHLQSPTSVNMAPSFSSPYSAAANMAQQPSVATPRHFSQPHIVPYRSNPGDPHGLSDMGFDSIGMEPAQYLRARGIYEDPGHLPISANDNTQSIPAEYLSTNFTTANHATLYSIPSTCGSLTEDTTFDTTMSGRQSDGYSDNISAPVHMVHADSQGSVLGPYGAGTESALAMSYSNSMGADGSLAKSYFVSDDDVRGIGSRYLSGSQVDHGLLPSPGPAYSPETTQAMERTDTLNTYSSLGLNPPDADMFDFSDCAGAQLFPADMERSISGTSARSNASLRIRAKTSLRRQLDNASKIQIQPKMAAPTKPTVSVGVSQPSRPTAPGSVKESGGSSTNAKVEITKAKRERPKSKKLFCDLCTHCPEGFRGDHELRRHKNSKHATTFKKWRCRDPRMDGEETTITVIRPLSDCKHCKEGKPYGIYYNAAAHLRRTHFKQKTSRKGSNGALPMENNNNPDADGAGDWPPMNELKKWMVEITIPGGQADSAVETGNLYEEDEDIFSEAQDVQANEDVIENMDTSIGTDMGDIPNYTYFGMGMGFAFSQEATTAAAAAMAARGDAVGRGMVHSAELQAEMPRLDGLQHQAAAMYAQGGGPISSAHFLEPQSNPSHLLREMSSLDSSGFVSSPSGTTITQGTAHPFIAEQHIDAAGFGFSQQYAPGDLLEFDYVPLGGSI